MKKIAVSVGALAILALASAAAAAPITVSWTNGVQAGSADITLGNGTVTVKLTNDTAITHDAGDLLTRFSVDISGMTGGTATAGTCFKIRTIANDGTFVQSAGVDLLALDTWDGTIVGNTLSFEFHPNGAHGLIGDDTGGDYSAANGSIKGNNGHNPYAYGDVTFQFDATGVTKDSAVANEHFFFGTDLPGGGVPEPASLGILALGVTGLLARRTRR